MLLTSLCQPKPNPGQVCGHGICDYDHIPSCSCWLSQPHSRCWIASSCPATHYPPCSDLEADVCGLPQCFPCLFALWSSKVEWRSLGEDSGVRAVLPGLISCPVVSGGLNLPAEAGALKGALHLARPLSLSRSG